MIYLASTSPRRHQLLGEITKDFKVINPNVTEKDYPELSAKEKCTRLSKDKCIAAVNRVKETGMVIAAGDTVVSLDDKILEKPTDENRARQMIKSLSGRTHIVYSAVSLYKDGVMYTFCDRAEVEFARIEDRVIDSYVKTSEPYDKAGGYRVQGFMSQYVKKVKGDITTVVGLPVQKLKKLMDFLKII